MLWNLSLVRQERDLKINAWFILETKNNVLSVMALKIDNTVPRGDSDPWRLETLGLNGFYSLKTSNILGHWGCIP